MFACKLHEKTFFKYVKKCRIWVVYYPWKKKVCKNLRLTRHLFKLFVLVVIERNFSNLKESCRFG